MSVSAIQTVNICLLLFLKPAVYKDESWIEGFYTKNRQCIDPWICVMPAKFACYVTSH